MNLEERFLKEYDAHADGIFRFCLFKLSDREVAKDLTQETFTKVWSYMAGGGEIRNIRAFLFQTARNLIIDKYRKKHTGSLEVMQEAGFDPVFEEEVEIEEKIDAQIAIQLLKELSEDHREVITLRFIEELSVKEISETIGETTSNVSVRLHRAMAKLRELYKQKNV
jgi:RNA polymerase sigma-70 factor (ECF subfamily)